MDFQRSKTDYTRKLVCGVYLHLHFLRSNTLRWCTLYALTIIVFRGAGRYIRAERVFVEDAVMMLSTIPLLLRMACVHVVLKMGTNNVDTTNLTMREIEGRIIGSQVVLASRIMYTAFLWTIKYSFSYFLSALTESVWRKCLIFFHPPSILVIYSHQLPR